MIANRQYRIRHVGFLKPARGTNSSRAALRKRTVTRRINSAIERVNRRIAIAWRINCLAGRELGE